MTAKYIQWWRGLRPWQDAALICCYTFVCCTIFLMAGWTPRLRETWGSEFGWIAVYSASGFLSRLAWVTWRRRHPRPEPQYYRPTGTPQ